MFVSEEASGNSIAFTKQTWAFCKVWAATSKSQGFHIRWGLKDPQSSLPPFPWLLQTGSIWTAVFPCIWAMRALEGRCVSQVYSSAASLQPHDPFLALVHASRRHTSPLRSLLGDLVQPDQTSFCLSSASLSKTYRHWNAVRVLLQGYEKHMDRGI